MWFPLTSYILHHTSLAGFRGFCLSTKLKKNRQNQEKTCLVYSIQYTVSVLTMADGRWQFPKINWIQNTEYSFIFGVDS